MEKQNNNTDLHYCTCISPNGKRISLLTHNDPRTAAKCLGVYAPTATAFRG